ncbi:MAG: RnfABCDGE type electron transport complex subunit B [Betaproteobacteria bacterium]|nr:RnfABCDGE type electron transport complex subunit B [Betaproteobacteria bacterium]
MQKKITPLTLSGFADALDKRLPQYQCERCGQPDCAHYAQALAARLTTPDRCAPGGRVLAEQLAAMCDASVLPGAVFDDEVLQCARVIEEACIGCARCLRACPLDALIGAPKWLHAVLPRLCSGCGLCVPTCPVDCIVMEPAGRVWSNDDAAAARHRYRARLTRLVKSAARRHSKQNSAKQNHAEQTSTETPEARQRTIAEALATARARRMQHRARRDVDKS